MATTALAAISDGFHGGGSTAAALVTYSVICFRIAASFVAETETLGSYSMRICLTTFSWRALEDP